MTYNRVAITGCGSGLGRDLLIEARRQKLIAFPHYRVSDVPYCLEGNIEEEGFADRLDDYLRHNHVNVFINNAGVYLNSPVSFTSDEEIERILNTNLTAQIKILKRVYTYFSQKGRGRIVNIISLTAKNPSPLESVYAASKMGLVGFSKCLQLDAVNKGVEIIDVFPGGMKTRMTEGRDNYNSLMDSQEVAKAIVRLLGERSLYTNEIVLRRRNESSSIGKA